MVAFRWATLFLPDFLEQNNMSSQKYTNHNNLITPSTLVKLGNYTIPRPHLVVSVLRVSLSPLPLGVYTVPISLTNRHFQQSCS